MGHHVLLVRRPPGGEIIFRSMLVEHSFAASVSMANGLYCGAQVAISAGAIAFVVDVQTHSNTFNNELLAKRPPEQ